MTSHCYFIFKKNFNAFNLNIILPLLLLSRGKCFKDCQPLLSSTAAKNTVFMSYQQSFIFNKLLCLLTCLRMYQGIYILREYMANMTCSKNITIIKTRHTSFHLIVTSTYKLGCTTISIYERKRMRCMGSGETTNCLRL